MVHSQGRDIHRRSRICFPGFGNGFVAISLLFFAFTTIMAYYYIAETNIAYLNRDKDRPWMSMVLKFVFLGAVFYGCIKTAKRLGL